MENLAVEGDPLDGDNPAIRHHMNLLSGHNAKRR
jgi:hypothetical protein